MNNELDGIEQLTGRIYDRSDKSFDRKLLKDLLLLAHKNQFEQSRSETQSLIHKLFTTYVDTKDESTEVGN
jgi:hypothetical protein